MLMLLRSAGSRSGRTLPTLLGVVLLLLGFLTAGNATVCGPGVDWMATCPSGVDEFTLRGTHTIALMGAGPVTADLVGVMFVFRGNPTGASPDLSIPTELATLSLIGGGLQWVAGDQTTNGVNDGGLLFSPGSIVEQADRLHALSFFDVFADLHLTPFGTLHNTAPARLRAVVWLGTLLRN